MAIKRELEWVSNDHPDAIPTNSAPNKTWIKVVCGGLLLAASIFTGLSVTHIIKHRAAPQSVAHDSELAIKPLHER